VLFRSNIQEERYEDKDDRRFWTGHDVNY